MIHRFQKYKVSVKKFQPLLNITVRSNHKKADGHNNASNSEKVYLHRKPNIRTSIQKTHTHKLETGLLHGSYKRFTPKRNIARPRAQETEHQNQYTKKKTNTS